MKKLSGLPLLATLFTFSAVVIMFALGLWQLQRAEEKTLYLQQLENSGAQPISSMTDSSSLTDGQKVAINGHLLTEQYLLLDNKVHQGRVGYQVLVPLLSPQGTVLVNFGWVPAPASRRQLPDVELPTGTFSATGSTAAARLNPMITETATGDNSWPKVVQQIDLPLFSQWLQRSLLPMVVQLDPEPSSGYQRHWQQVVMPPEKHIGYAIQWFGLALACMLVYLFALFKSKREVSPHV